MAGDRRNYGSSGDFDSGFKPRNDGWVKQIKIKGEIMENNNPNGENISQNPTVAPTPMPTETVQEPAVAPVTADTSGVPIGGGVNAEVAQAPASAPTEAVLTEQNTGMAPGAMPAGASLRPETMQSRKVTKSIKLPGAKKSHKGLIITIIVTVILALGAGVAWWFIAGPGKEEGKHSETHWPCTSEDPGLCLNGEGSDTNGDVEEGSADVEIISLTDVPTGVMEFYNAVVTTPYGVEMVASDASRWWLYADSEVAQGRIPKYLMLEIAYDGLDFNEKWSQCKGEYYYFNDESRGRVTDYCVDAARIRDRVKEIFGVEIEFNIDDHVGTHNRVEICGTKDYSVENDEFYTTDDGCGGMDIRRVLHWLTAAERRGDEIMLYETALYSEPTFLATIGENVDDGEIILENWDTYAEQEGINGDPKNITDPMVVEKFNKYIWKFKKDADDRYVFEGLEKVKE